MKPDWDKLMSTYAGSQHSLVADVDCTAGGKSLCEKHGVKGYPTIKWGDPSDLKDYDGGRELKDLQKFASENLGPTCGPDNLDLCDATDKKFIEKFKKWDIDELDLAIEEKDEKIKKIEKEGQKVVDALEKQVQSLEAKIEKENKRKDDGLAKVKKESGYSYMKAVKASKAPKVDPDEDPVLSEKEPKEEKKEEL